MSLLLALAVLGNARDRARKDAAEAKRLDRVRHRFLYANGALVEYHSALTRGVFVPNFRSGHSDAVPPYQHFGRIDGEEFVRYRQYGWPEAHRAAGLDLVYDWVRGTGYGGAVEFVVWIPGVPAALTGQADGDEPRFRILGRTPHPCPALREGGKAPAYPPPHLIYNNPYWGSDCATMAGASGPEHVGAIIDCESIDQIRQVIGRFGPVA